MIEKNILHYKILEKLGEGGMGIVYLAQDTKLERKVAIKFLPHHIAANSDERKRFEIEAKAAAALNHPNIATIHAIEEFDNKLFLVMEYIEGQELKDIVRAHRDVPQPQAIDIAIQIAQGLQAAHEKNIIHRDIKSSNIMVTKNGVVKIMDFGLAKVRGSAQLTQTGTTVGTVAYMSPEQAMGEEVDERTDIWSFGVVLYEMLSGKLPFPGDYNQAIQYAIINSDPQPLEPRFKQELPFSLYAIIEKTLDKDIETRYNSMAGILVDLKRLKKGSTAFSQTMPAAKITEKKTLKKQSLYKSGYVAIISLSLILLTYIVYQFLTENDEAISKPDSKLSQVTFSGNLTGAAISPDGKSLAYIKQITKFDSEIIIRDINNNNELKIFEGKVYTYIPLKWTPDGTQILFHRVMNNSFVSANLISRLGGDVKQLINGAVQCFSPDDSRFIAEPSGSKWIRFYDFNSNEKGKIEIIGNFTWRNEIEWSPQGDKLLFISKSIYEYAIWIIDINGHNQRKIIAEKDKILSPCWSKDGNSIYYFKDLGATKNLLKVKIDSSERGKVRLPKIIQKSLKVGDSFSISDNNRLIIFEGITEYSNLKLFKKREGNFIESTLTAGTALISTPFISPDNQWVAYSKGDYDISNIFISSLKDNETRQLTFFKTYCFYPSWSPDSKSLVFSIEEKDQILVRKLNLGDGKITQLNTGDLSTGSAELNWITKDEFLFHLPGNRNYMFYDITTNEKRKLLLNDSLGWIFNPRLSPDKNKIAVFWNRYDRNAFDYNNRKSLRGLWIISLSDSSKKRLTSNDFPFPLEWSIDGKGIYAVDEAEPTEILKIDANTGKAELYYKLPFNNAGEIDISPDGNIIVAPEITKLSDVLLIENFDPEVESD